MSADSSWHETAEKVDHFLDSVMHNIAYLRAQTVIAQTRLEALRLVSIPPPITSTTASDPAAPSVPTPTKINVADYTAPVRELISSYTSILGDEADLQMYVDRFSGYKAIVKRERLRLDQMKEKAPDVDYADEIAEISKTLGQDL
jgi:hypothetical protein